MLRGLAGRLVADPATADDAVQEAWLAALERKPDADRPLEPWLKRVLRNTVARFRRGRARAQRRERLVARPERAPDAGALAERGRLLRALLDEVLTLPEAERESVLLRYYEGLPPRDIATRLGVPVELVYRRLEHALERMRGRMDARHGGQREVWCLGLVAALGLPRELLAPATAAAAGLSTGTAVGVGQAASAASLSLSGATLMGATATTVTASVITLGLGLGAGWLAKGELGAPEPGAVGRESDASDLQPHVVPSSVATPRLEGSETSKREATLQAEVKALREQVATLTAAKEALEQEKAAASAPFDPKALRFGLSGATPNFDKANWEQLATHVAEMAKAMPRLKDDLAAGAELSPEVKQMLQEHNMPLAMFAVTTSAELKGTGPNGAYTHPAVIANLMRAALIAANEPLTQAQEQAIVTLGNAWAADAERSTKALPADAPALAGTVAEVDAKQRFLESVKSQLTGTQRAVLFHAETEGRMGLDLLSPALVYMLHSDAGVTDPATLPTKALGALLVGAGLKDVDASAYLGVAARWIDESPWGSTPRMVRDPETMFPRLDALQAFARAQVSATQRVIEAGRLTPEQVARLRKLDTLIMPYVVRPM